MKNNPKHQPLTSLERSRRYEDKHRKECPNCKALITREALLCRTCTNKAREEQQRGEANPNWKGGTTRANGYVLRYVQPTEFGRRYKLEHHIVWEEANGKPLPEGWVIHHLNGMKDDNRIENLLACPIGEHHKNPHLVAEAYEKRIRELERQLNEHKT